MASKLSELIEYMKSTNNVIQCKLSDMHYQPDGSIIVGTEKYDIALLAMQHMSKMLGIPAAYAKRIPTDLRAVNFEYFASRSDVTVNIVMSDGVISEIHDSLGERSIQAVLQTVMGELGFDPSVIQADINQKYVSFYLYDETKMRNVKGIELYDGFFVMCPIDMNAPSYFSPALINDIDETAIEFTATDRFLASHDSDDMQDFETVIKFGLANVDLIDKALDNSDNKLEDGTHFATHFGSNCGVNSSNREKIVEEAGLSGADTCFEMAEAVMTVEMRTNNMRQFQRLANLAGSAFYANDPSFCPRCHQEVEVE